MSDTVKNKVLYNENYFKSYYDFMEFSITVNLCYNTLNTYLKNSSS